jgi:hypothetical protein
MDWKKLPFVDWLTLLGAIGLFFYGIYCIVVRHGRFLIPFHSTELGSISDGMAVWGVAAVRTGIAYLFFALFLFGHILLKQQPEPSEETARNIFFLFIAAVLCLFWAMFSM